MGANCTTSASLAILFCCKGCNAEKLRNAFAYIPPQNSSYAVEDGKSGEHGRIVYMLEGLNTYTLYQQAAEACDIHWVKTRRGERIPCAWVKIKGLEPFLGEKDIEKHPYVVLHCHGNATDIGMMMAAYWELSQKLGIVVVGVEYSGYGVATGKPSSGNTYADVEAAYEELRERGVPPERIVAYGQSVGSGPAMYAASKYPLAGVILHSPLLSGIKVVDPQPEQCCRPSCMFGCFDFYPNDKRMKNITCPALIMHGQKDEVVPFYHGARLHYVCPGPQKWQPYFPRNAGHNDIVESNARGYFNEVAHFLHGLEKRRKGSLLDPSGVGVAPVQVDMEHRVPGQPVIPVGPEDGRYAKMRGEQGDQAQNKPGEGLEVCIGAPDVDDPEQGGRVKPGKDARTLQGTLS